MFHFNSIEHYHACLKSGSTTCTEAVEFYLSAIEEKKELNSFLEVFADEARARAKMLDQQSQWGRLHGVVVGIKDNICYKDHISSASSLIIQNFRAPYSATVVERLLEEGAIIIGRQNCDEFGMGSTNENSAFGPVLNPDNYDHVAGGSSGGSAAAVKAGLCMASLGSDTGGSVRLPASFCGVIGYKPAYGSVSRHGLIAYASSFDQIGILASNIEDVSLIFDVIKGPDEFDSTCINTYSQSGITENTNYRIAYFPEWIEHPSVDVEIKNAFIHLLRNVKELGHTVEPVSFSLTDVIVPAYYILTTAEASSNLARFDGLRYGNVNAESASDLQNHYLKIRSEGFGNEVKKRIMLGSFVLSEGYHDAYYTKAQKVRNLLVKQTKDIFENYDFIISPTSPNIAYKRGKNSIDQLAIYIGDIFTVFANLTGIPAISLPVFKHYYNLPFGLQVQCSPHNEVSLQRFSHQLMLQ